MTATSTPTFKANAVADEYLRAFGYSDKQEVLDDSRAYWNPQKTEFWSELGVPLVIGERSGYTLKDVAGHEFIDMHLNGGTFNLGHRHPDVVDVLKRGADLVDVGNHHFPSAGRAALARELVATVPGASKVVFGSSGGESIDLAIKSARHATGRRKVVSIRRAYHGHTGLSIAAGDDRFLRLFHSQNADFAQVTFNDLDEMEAALANDDVAAVLLETIPATYGFPLPAPGYLAGVAALARQYGAVYIADEVQTGLGRTGPLWAYQGHDVTPDIVVTGKGLGGGMYPITAAILNARTSQWLAEDGFAHMSTFGGAELGCLVALKTLEITQAPETRANVEALAVQLGEGIARIAAEYPRTITGIRQSGLIIGIEFGEVGAKAVSPVLYEHGVWAIFATLDPVVLQFKPGLLLSPAEADRTLNALRLTCAALATEERDVG